MAIAATVGALPFVALAAGAVATTSVEALVSCGVVPDVLVRTVWGIGSWLFVLVAREASSVAADVSVGAAGGGKDGAALMAATSEGPAPLPL